MVGDTFCKKCTQPCQGEVLRYNDDYFHRDCLQCDECHSELESGLFACGDEFFCLNDYNKLYGHKCVVCDRFLEGDGVTLNDKDYHESCFTCCRCRVPFPRDVQINYTGTAEDYMCEHCVIAPEKPALSKSPVSYRLHTCEGCGDEIRGTQALRALDKHWHLWCFTCTKCHCLLSGEYMGNNGKPYCEKDYQELFGVSCASCNNYITGKVLQAGEKNYHPQCSQCAYCHQKFGEGEEMYLQGNEIWHPRCSQEMEMQSQGKQVPNYTRAPSPPTRTAASRDKKIDVKTRPYSYHESSSALRDYTGRIEPKGSPSSFNGPANANSYQEQSPFVYPYDLLKRDDPLKRLPKDVDKTKLECHLSEEEFSEVFGMSRIEFYKLPVWKRNNMKKKLYIF